MKDKITIGLVIITTFLLFICASTYMMRDRTAPEISAPSIELTYVEGSDTSNLLAAVTAIDDEDGDISDQVRIYDIAVLADGRRAQVTYAVYDSSYNLAKATRIVGYETASKDVSEEIENEASDDADSVADEKENNEETQAAGNEEQDENEEVAEGYEDLPLESDGEPVIRLTTHEVHIDAGDGFYSMDYVEDAVDAEDSREYLYRNMYLEGSYDTDTAGEYELSYYCIDSDGNVSNIAKLMLIVEE